MELASPTEGWVPRTKLANHESFYPVAETKARAGHAARSRSGEFLAQPGCLCALGVLRVGRGALKADQSRPRPRQVTPLFKRDSRFYQLLALQQLPHR